MLPYSLTSLPNFSRYCVFPSFCATQLIFFLGVNNFFSPVPIFFFYSVTALCFAFICSSTFLPQCLSLFNLVFNMIFVFFFVCSCLLLVLCKFVSQIWIIFYSDFLNFLLFKVEVDDDDFDSDCVFLALILPDFLLKFTLITIFFPMFYSFKGWLRNIHSKCA